jgi:hypothetical protein
MRPSLSVGHIYYFTMLDYLMNACVIFLHADSMETPNPPAESGIEHASDRQAQTHDDIAEVWVNLVPLRDVAQCTNPKASPISYHSYKLFDFPFSMGYARLKSSYQLAK